MMTTSRLAIVGALALITAGQSAAGPLTPCDRLYAEVVLDGAVDYAKVATHPQRAACLRALADAAPPDPKTAPAAAVAFWADAYNLLALLAIAEDPQRWSPQQDGKLLFRDRLFSVAGQRLSLDQIEHEQLAASTHDPRVEFLLSCGSRACGLLPNRLLSSAGDPRVTAAMQEGMRRWFARPDNLRVRRQPDGTGVVEVGQLLQLDWHGGDFEQAGTPLVELVATALETQSDAKAGPKAAADLRAGRLRIVIRPYDWRVNRTRRLFLLP